ncbi:hypothetical protein CSOJ01_10690 [Colletotrichum sojae]|uniref:Uncharacterized protein n=1 Tax=Colletotrichum sojae TaxID=2175907 RepID=A0A8H6MPU4_9PEZI|nr:hypothetical protein CSOJ01_10690 [Colletotrichum sojae]
MTAARLFPAPPRCQLSSNESNDPAPQAIEIGTDSPCRAGLPSPELSSLGLPYTAVLPAPACLIPVSYVTSSAQEFHDM